MTSDRRLVMELQCNMALRWFVGLNIDEQAWDASTFSQNRRRRFDEDGTLEFDLTVRRAIEEGLISRHASADGTLVRANASFKSYVPIEVALDPAEYKRKLRAQDEESSDGPQDPGNRAVDFRGEKRSNKTHRSATEIRTAGSFQRAAQRYRSLSGDTVNAVMENRRRILLGLGVEIFASSRSEEEGTLQILDRVKKRFGYWPHTLGADKSFFHGPPNVPPSGFTG